MANFVSAGVLFLSVIGKILCWILLIGGGSLLAFLEYKSEVTKEGKRHRKLELETYKGLHSEDAGSLRGFREETAKHWCHKVITNFRMCELRVQEAIDLYWHQNICEPEWETVLITGDLARGAKSSVLECVYLYTGEADRWTVADMIRHMPINIGGGVRIDFSVVRVKNAGDIALAVAEEMERLNAREISSQAVKEFERYVKRLNAINLDELEDEIFHRIIARRESVESVLDDFERQTLADEQLTTLNSMVR